MRLAEKGLTLGDIDLGGLDAESDHNLASHFITTAHMEAALAGRRTLVLGRKGSGKSAIFRQLSPVAEERGLPVSVLQLTPDEYAWAALKAYQEQGLLPEHAHTNAWKVTLAIEAAGRLISLDRRWSPEADSAIKRLRQFVTENFGELQPSLLTTATKVVRGLRSFNLSAFGFGVGINREDPEAQPITPALIDALLNTMAAPLREQPLLIGLDRLDDSWDGSREAHDLLIGLLKAAKGLNDRFGPEEGTLRIVAFLRSDVYDGLRFDDKDKHRPTEDHISWDADGLREMLNKRLPDGVEADDLFEAGEMRGSIKPFNYIVKRTFLRPREILQFVNLAIKGAGRTATEASKDSVREAELIFSRWKVEDLKQEFAKVNPEFEELLEALRQEVHRYDSIEELADLLQRKAAGAVERIGMRGALELLFEASVIGIRLKGVGSTRFKAEDPQLTLPASGAVYAHQSLYKGLNIVETRMAAEEPVEEDNAIRD